MNELVTKKGTQSCCAVDSEDALVEAGDERRFTDGGVAGEDDPESAVGRTCRFHFRTQERSFLLF